MILTRPPIAIPLDPDTLTKARILVDRNRAIAAHARPLAQQLRRWVEKLVRAETLRARANPRRYAGLQKREGDDSDASPEDELRELLIRFGFREADRVAQGTLLTDAISNKPTRISYFQEWRDAVDQRARGLTEGVRERIRNNVRDIVLNSDGLTTQQIARRIATSIHAVEPETGGEPDRVYVFSFERAETIARTELVQVENTAQMAGFELTGVETVEWLAYSDGLSGDRHHERMNGEVIKLGDTFKTPLGNSLRYPGDPRAPIEDTANCRCAVRPGRAKR